MDNTRTRTKCVHNRSSQIFKTGSEMCIIRQSVSCHPPSIHPTPKKQWKENNAYARKSGTKSEEKSEKNNQCKYAQSLPFIQIVI